MSASFTIQLHDLQFSAFHGVYKEEARVGNQFEVNISLTIDAPEEKVLNIDETINYATVYGIVKELMAHRQALLETLAMEMAETLKRHFPAVLKTVIQIKKLQPPIAAFTGSVSVTYTKDYNG